MAMVLMNWLKLPWALFPRGDAPFGFEEKPNVFGDFGDRKKAPAGCVLGDVIADKFGALGYEGGTERNGDKLACIVGFWRRPMRSVPMSTANARDVVSFRVCLMRREKGSTAMTKTVPESGQPWVISVKIM